VNGTGAGAYNFSEEINFNGGTYCCGGDACMEAVVEFYYEHTYGEYTPRHIADLLDGQCEDVECCSCPIRSCLDHCSQEVVDTFGDQAAFCALTDKSCLDHCGAETVAFVEAHV
jgi:hypothetical protein